MTAKSLWAKWKAVARKIARVQTAILLVLVYAVIFVPVGAMLRLAGWDPLDNRGFGQKPSNWRRPGRSIADPESLRHQS